MIRLQYDTEINSSEFWELVKAAITGSFFFAAALLLMRVTLLHWLGGLKRLRDVVEDLGTGAVKAESINARNEPLEIRRVVEMFNPITASGHVWNGEICNRNRAGGLYWVDASIVPLAGMHGAALPAIVNGTTALRYREPGPSARARAFQLANGVQLASHAPTSVAGIGRAMT